MEAQCQITRAQARVLIKASAHPVMIAGGFSGKPEPGQWRRPRFDRQTHIDRLIVARLLEPGIGANTFVITPGGVSALEKIPDAWKKSIQERLADE